MKRKEPTSTSIVEQAMKNIDDFVTGQKLQEVTGLDSCHVSAALYCFKHYHAAECLEENGKLWWFLTPESDQRVKKVAERTPEMKPRKTRKPKKEIQNG